MDKWYLIDRETRARMRELRDIGIDPDQHIIPRVSENGRVYLEPTDHIIDHNGQIVFKRGSGHSQ